MTDISTQAIEHSVENPGIHRPEGCYSDEVYYTVRVEDRQDISQKLQEVLAQIGKLEEQREVLIKQLLKKTPGPRGWKVRLKQFYSDGTLDVVIHKEIYRETKKPQPPALPVHTPPPEKTTLEKLLGTIGDAKTLFNSGILSRAEKRELLGLPAEKSEAV